MRHGIKILFTLFTLITLSGCARILPTKEKTYTVGLYNLEKLYDAQDNPYNTAYNPDGELQWNSIRYEHKLKNLGQAIAIIGGKDGPAILGVTEVENAQVLQALLNEPPLRKKKFQFIHFESEDRLGLDVALIYNPKSFKPLEQKAVKVDFPQRNFKGKDILQVKGELGGQPVILYINHWPANYGNAAQGTRNRRAAASTLRGLIDADLKQNQDANILVIGDFDEEPNSQLLQQVLKANGRPNPNYKTELFNTFYINYVQGLGSYHRRGNFMMLDQILVSKALLDQQGLEYVHGSAQIYAPEFLKYTFGKYKNTPRTTYNGTTYIGGYSDHFPVYIKLKKVR